MATDTTALIDCAIDDLRAAGLDPRQPVVAGAFAGALAGKLATNTRRRPLADLLAEAVSLTLTTLQREPTDAEAANQASSK